VIESHYHDFINRVSKPGYILQPWEETIAKALDDGVNYERIIIISYSGVNGFQIKLMPEDAQPVASLAPYGSKITVEEKFGYIAKGTTDIVWW